MSKGADALRMLIWSSALFVQAGTAVESASFWEDVKKLQEEGLEGLPAEHTYKKDDWAREKLRKLVEIDSSFRKYSAIWRCLLLTLGWSLIDFGSSDSDAKHPFPSENLALSDSFCISVRVRVMAENSKEVVPAELAEDAEVVWALFCGGCLVHTLSL